MQMDIWASCFEMNVYCRIKSCSGSGRFWSFARISFAPVGWAHNESCYTCTHTCTLCQKKPSRFFQLARWNEVEWYSSINVWLSVWKGNVMFLKCTFVRKEENVLLWKPATQKEWKYVGIPPKKLDSAELQTAQQNVCPTFTLHHNW